MSICRLERHPVFCRFQSMEHTIYGASHYSNGPAPLLLLEEIYASALRSFQVEGDIVYDGFALVGEAEANPFVGFDCVFA